MKRAVQFVAVRMHQRKLIQDVLIEGSSKGSFQFLHHLLIRQTGRKCTHTLLTLSAADSGHSQANMVGPPSGVVNVGHPWVSDCPLIPHLVVCRAAPHAHAEGLPSRTVHRLLQGEVDGKPAEHVGRVAGRVCAQVHLYVKKFY